MDRNDNTKANLHDHNNHLPKDILNVEQDPNSFRDPLEQQLEKQQTNKSSNQTNNKDNKEKE